MTQEETMRGASKGDAVALREFFVSTRQEVERTCALFLGGDEALTTVVVGVYGRAFKALGRGQRPGLPLADWLRVLAVRECLAVMQRLRRDFDQQTRMLESLAGSIPTLVEIAADPVERVNFMIRADIDEIPEEPRTVLACIELEGLRLPAMAGRMGWSWAFALRRLMDARRILAGRVKQAFGL